MRLKTQQQKEKTSNYMDLKDLNDFIKKLNEMDLKDRDLYQQYSVMKNASKVIDTRIEEISQYILDEMNRIGEIKKEFDFGKFTIVPKKTYKYTDAVEIAAKQLKELKKKVV